MRVLRLVRIYEGVGWVDHASTSILLLASILLGTGTVSSCSVFSKEQRRLFAWTNSHVLSNLPEDVVIGNPTSSVPFPLEPGINHRILGGM